MPSTASYVAPFSCALKPLTSALMYVILAEIILSACYYVNIMAIVRS